MDAVNDDRGQALVMAALLLAIAAAVFTGLSVAQEHIAANERERGAGEAAVEAATAVFADAYAAEARAAASGAPTFSAVAAAVSAVRVREDARAAADSLSALNGGGAVDEPSVACANGSVSVTITVAERHYRAGFSAPLCSPR